MLASLTMCPPGPAGPAESRVDTRRVIEHIGISTDQGRFDALAAGPDDGRGVLLLHGFPEAATQWEHQLATLSVAGCRAVAPDQRRHFPRARRLGGRHWEGTP